MKKRSYDLISVYLSIELQSLGREGVGGERGGGLSRRGITLSEVCSWIGIVPETALGMENGRQERRESCGWESSKVVEMEGNWTLWSSGLEGNGIHACHRRRG